MRILTYGAQSWAWTKNQIEGLRKTQRSMERSLMGVRLKEKTK